MNCSVTDDRLPKQDAARSFKSFIFLKNLNELNDSTAAARPLFFSLAFPCALGINFLREKVRYRSSRIISRNMRRLRLLLAGRTSLSWTQTCSIEWTSPSVNGPQRETPAISILDNQILKCLASSTELWPYLAASSQEWLSGAVLFALKKLIVSPMKSDFFLQLWSWYSLNNSTPCLVYRLLFVNASLCLA